MGNHTRDRPLCQPQEHHTSDTPSSRQQRHRSDTDKRFHSGGASAKRSAHHVPGFKSWSAVSTQKSVPGARKDLLERRRFGGTRPGLDQVFCRVGRIEKSCDESGDHSRKENLMNNVREKNKRLVLDAKTLLLEFLAADRKSTRLNSSHVAISYAVF